MKKISTLILGLIIIVSIKAYSQSSNVISAWSYLQNDELTLAKKAIDAATIDESTSQKPKTWYYRALVYQAIYEDSTKHSLAPDALIEVLAAYEKASTLDEKKEYADKIPQELAALRVYFFNDGIRTLRKKDFAGSYSDFSHALAASNFMSANYGKLGVDTLSMFYTAYTGMQIGKLDTAKILYSTLSGYTYNTAENYKFMQRNVYLDLATIYKEQKDTASALATLKKGEQLAPDEESLIIAELNIELAQKKFAQAITGLKAAIQLEPANAGFYYNLGLAYEQTKDMTDAEAAYRKAVELKPDYGDAQYSIGALYFNRAVEVNKQMNDLPPTQQARYVSMSKTRDSLFQMALPELEKAHQINPKDMETLRALRELYTRTNQLDKAAEIKKEMDALEPGKQ
jgi:tetratricopeptide (TPR) repeat protein